MISPDEVFAESGKNTGFSYHGFYDHICQTLMTSPIRDAILDAWRRELFCWRNAALNESEPEDGSEGPSALAAEQAAAFMAALQSATVKSIPSCRARRAGSRSASGTSQQIGERFFSTVILSNIADNFTRFCRCLAASGFCCR